MIPSGYLVHMVHSELENGPFTDDCPMKTSI